ncbi:MAG: universal stress protein [Herminiimonas sp.]|nr:universal stress protein [Herminiimonas sp.]
MSFKTILVHANQSDIASGPIRIAVALARRFDAHLIGVVVTGLSQEVYFPDSFGASAPVLMESLLALEAEANARLAVVTACAREGGVASVEQRLVRDEAAAGISLSARYADLVVVGQIDPAVFTPFLRPDFPQRVVIDSGRPVLIVPYAGNFAEVGRRIILAWDGSREAARAATAGIALMQQAQLVQVAVFDSAGPTTAHGEEPGADMALYLVRHGIRVEVVHRRVAAGTDIGNALLSHAADFDADLIIMGAYGHSRVREIFLGGVTRTVLASMTVPVLMSH